MTDEITMRRARYIGPVRERAGLVGWAFFEPGPGHPPGDEEIWNFQPASGEFFSCPRYDLEFLPDPSQPENQDKST